MSATLLPPVCLLAGGRGIRLGSLTDSLPKPMVEVAGRPFIDWPLFQLKDAGFTRVVICIGYCGDALREHVKDGSAFGLEVDYSEDGPDLIGTLGAVRRATPLLGTVIPLMYADTYLRVDFAAVARAHMAGAFPWTMTVLHNRGRWDTSNCVVADGLVVAYSKKPPPEAAEWIDYGFSVLSAEVIVNGGEADLASLAERLSGLRQIAASPVADRFFEIGTPEGLLETSRFLSDQCANGRRQ